MLLETRKRSTEFINEIGINQKTMHNSNPNDINDIKPCSILYFFSNWISVVEVEIWKR